MYRASNDLFTRTGLTLDHHRDPCGTDLLQDPKDLSHANRLADDIPEGFSIGWKDLDPLIERLEAFVRLALRNGTGGLEVGFFDPDPVDEPAR